MSVEETKKAIVETKKQSPSKTVETHLRSLAPQIEVALPKHMSSDRMIRVALSSIRTNPKLLECNVASLLAAVMQCAQLGLEPNLLGHAYLVPFKNQVQLIVGYRGMIDLARRSGHIRSIQCNEVYANDLFELEYGLEDKLRHVPWHLRTDADYESPGDFRGAYMVAKLTDGGHQLLYMSKQQIDDHRAKSRSGSSGPWATDYVEMAKKTVIRAAFKYLPISIEVAERYVSSDEQISVVNTDKTGSLDDIIETVEVSDE